MFIYVYIIYFTTRNNTIKPKTNIHIQLTRYWHRLIHVGIHEYEAFYNEHPGKSAFFMACQGCELMMGLAKLWAIAKGTGKHNFVTNLTNHSDMVGTAMVFNNQVDFVKLVKELNKDRLLIRDDINTPKIEKQLIAWFPKIGQQLIKAAQNFKVGDNIPSIYDRIYAGYKDECFKDRQKLLLKLVKDDDPTINEDNIDEQSIIYQNAQEKMRKEQGKWEAKKSTINRLQIIDNAYNK